MKIKIETIPHKDQRYETCGDWQFDHEGTLRIYVSDMADWRSAIAVAIHEMIEAMLCREHGVPEHLVTDWDLKHIESPDPGSLEGCPYRNEHESAEFVERASCIALFQYWNEHENSVKRLSEQG